MRGQLGDLLAVGLGGSFGTAARVGLSLIALTYLPGLVYLATLAANVLGAGLIGYLSRRPLGGRARAFWATGFCGGFTTFSLFSLEVVLLLQRDIRLGLGYGALSVVLWMLAVWAGQRVAQA
ncbi:MAG: fluoride efflux transporter FluC [Roseinatronobacter sp.]